VTPRAQLTAATHAAELASPELDLHRLGVGLYHLHTGAPRIDVERAASILRSEIWRGGLLAAQDVQHPDGDDRIVNTTASATPTRSR